MRIITSILGKYAVLAAIILLLLSSLATATFYLTEEIRGDASRINLAGRQRMHIFHLANHAHFLLGNNSLASIDVGLHLREIDKEIIQVLHGLKSGCQVCEIDRPRQSAAHDVLEKQLDRLIALWNGEQVEGPEEKQTLPTGQETILLVDDEPVFRTVIRQLLDSLGYKVLEAASVREAIQIADQQLAAIDLLVTDVVMPE